MQENCDICCRVKCKRCGWIASNEEAILVAREVITVCSICGWSPREDVVTTAVSLPLAAGLLRPRRNRGSV